MSAVAVEPFAPPRNMTLSKNIPLRDRLIFALHVSGRDEADYWIELLGDSVWFYKLGLQLLMTADYFPLVDHLVRRGKKVFADIKMFDIPETVASAVQQLNAHKVTFVTVHGQDEMIRAAAKVKQEVKLLAVTVLTSFTEQDALEVHGTADIQRLVLERTRRVLDLGCDGVISSGLEVPALREHYGNEFMIVVPGIRPPQNSDDQKRVVDVEEAFRRGADYIVVGRPIRQSDNPKNAADDIQRRIADLFSTSE